MSSWATVSKIAASTKNRSWWQSHPRVAILFSENGSDIPVRQAAHLYLENIYLALRNTSVNHPSLRGLGSRYTLRHQSSELSKQGLGTRGEGSVIIFSGGILLSLPIYTTEASKSFAASKTLCLPCLHPLSGIVNTGMPSTRGSREDQGNSVTQDNLLMFPDGEISAKPRQTSPNGGN